MGTEQGREPVHCQDLWGRPSICWQAPPMRLLGGGAAAAVGTGLSKSSSFQRTHLLTHKCSEAPGFWVFRTMDTTLRF